MRKITTLALCAALSIPAFAAPTLASAQQYRDYGRGQSPCQAQKKQGEREGAVAGALIGGVLGAAVAGDGNRGEGALVGGTVGAFSGREVGRKNVRCANYPKRVSYRRNNCRWVQENRGGRWQGFEVCRNRNGEWRPSGRY
jgi:outer membrane lipoprotein SlyB